MIGAIGIQPASASAVALAPMSDAELMKSRYADDYRKLLRLLATTASTSRSPIQPCRSMNRVPREVKDFYGAVFKPIDDIIAANAAHNRMVKLISRDAGAPLVDMAAGVDGIWDDDLYLDIVHFTEAGNERVANLMIRSLLPILAERHNLRCDLR